MEYQAWKMFLDAAELGSLSKVALAYNSSQPQISRRIHELEETYGGRLFQRTGRGVTLTELGQRILPKVRAWIASTEQLDNDIRTTSGKPVGTVRLGIMPSTAHPLVSSLFEQLRKRFPLIQLNVREGQGAHLEHWLENGHVDLAILFRFSPTPKNGDIYLFETGTYLVSATGDALTAEAEVAFSVLDGLPLVSFCRPNSWRDHLDNLAHEQGISLNVQAEADSLSLQTQIVADGHLYALLGPYAIAAASRNVRIQSSRIVAPAVPRYTALAMSPHGELTLACKTVMQVIREIATSGAEQSQES